MIDIDALQATRHEKDELFKQHPQSPLTEAQKAAFDGLRYYDPNPALAFVGDVEPFEAQEQILMATNRDELKPYVRHGVFAFEVAGQTVSLVIYRSMDQNYFLPFVDSNAGTETYPAGRYLDLATEDGVQFLVDFNLAYNPYCAYNDNWTCPVTPAENRIDVPIEAGERLPAGDWTDA